MEYMYNATRDCSAKKSAKLDADARLSLVLYYPQPSVGVDIPSLVSWVDTMNKQIAECDYGNRNAEYIVERHIMPLSAYGPSSSSIERLMDILGSLDYSKEDADTKLMLYNMRSLLSGVVPVSKLDIMHGAPRLPSLLMSAYFTVAAMKGMLTRVLEEQVDMITSVRTDPDSSWSLTPLALKPGANHVKNRDGGSFVFRAEKGGVARIHNMLRRAKCRFDHWKRDDTHRIETGDAVISASTSDISIYLEKEKRTYTVTAGRSEWWDEQYGAAVIPVGAGKPGSLVSLVVIPGDCRKSAPLKLYPTAKQSRDSSAVALAYLESLRSSAFVVTLDETGSLPVASTDTDDLVRLFVAYAYAGSRLGTRLMHLVAARSIYDPRKIRVPGYSDADAHDAIRHTILGASCPLGAYSALALVHRPDSDSVGDVTRDLDVIRDLRCTNHDL
jgi:hypothetical protein